LKTVKQLITSLQGLGRPHRLMRAVFCAVWLGLALAFTWFALDARVSMRTQLARSGFRIPLNRNIQAGNVRLQEIINTLADKYDGSMLQLEQTLRRSARTSFHVNATAALLSLIGFAAQLLQASRCTQSDPQAKTGSLPKAALASSSLPEAAPESVKTHDGSFPEGGYAL
jgi:hypothetical protein